MKAAIAVVVVLIVLAVLVGRARAQATKPSKPSENPYRGLRQMAFTNKRAEIGIPAPAKATEPWGVIMETGYEKANMTLVALADGNASIYLSSGGGFLGGIEQEPIRKAAKAAVAAAAPLQWRMKATAEFPEAKVGEIIFYLRTDEGVFMTTITRQQQAENNQEFLPLFLAMQEVVTQYRLVDESKQKKASP